MSSALSTPAPPFPLSVRLATLADAPRIGVVAAAGFYHTPMFHYERPRYAEFPLDTMSAYRAEYRSDSRDPNSIVLVVEASLRRDEAESVYGELAAVYPDFEQQIPSDALAQEKAIVSVVTLHLLPGSGRAGQFQPSDEHDTIPDDPLNKRDQSEHAVNTVSRLSGAAHAEKFRNRHTIGSWVTHPAYWRQGHMGAATRWLLDLAALDHMGVGVSAMPMGRLAAEALGFVEVGVVEYPGYEPEHPKPIASWLGVRDPAGEKESDDL